MTTPGNLHHLAWGRHLLGACGAVSVSTTVHYPAVTCPRCNDLVARHGYRERYPEGPLSPVPHFSTLRP